MAELDISQAAVLGFLRERGGRVRNTELLSAFRPLLEAGGDAAARTERRERFKAAVNAVAVVKERDGTKFVVLRRELRPAPPPGGDGGGAGPVPDPGPGPELIPDPDPTPDPELIPDPDPVPELIPDPVPELIPDPVPELIPDPIPDPVPELLRDPTPSPTPDPSPDPIPDPDPTGRLSPPPPQDLPSPRAVAELRGLFQGGGGGVPLPTGTAGSRREPQAKPCMLPVRCVPPPAAAPAAGPPEEPGSPLSPPQLEEEAGSRSPGLRRVPKNHRSSEEVAVMSLEETEHQWLVMVSGGQWTQQLHGLLLSDASLAARRDFISGFTALHWAAKSGNCDMMKNIITQAEKGGVHVNVDARSYSGYTALHLAAIHGQEKVITMLVYSYHAKTDLRDYSGKKPHQYLKEGTSSAVRRLLGDPSLAHSTEPTVPIKKTTKLAASILSSTSTFLGVISDDMAFYDLTKGLRKPSSLSKLLAATTGPRRKPKTRGGFPSYSSLSEVTEEEEEEVVVKRRPVSELFFGH